ncbi:hypothetical protein GGI10_004884 [Coemansia sp. RSA 2530]|nr:hypothetical protein GGI10_004884 [Coemansia sp. RSA 2530]
MDTGLTEIRESKFNLVDLAGSERQKLANTSGMRLKEAANINKSLSTLGNVINSLVDISNGRPRHVNYRDSKLTFLLRDSLGGNSVTFIIANVSPAMCNDAETASTLRFAQRAKMIRNKAVVNQDMQGNVPQLQAEISRLKLQIAQMRSNGSSGMDSSLASSEYTVSPYPETVVSNDPGGIGVGPAGLSSKEVGAMQYFVRLALRKERESERQKAYYSEKMIQLKFSLARHRRHLQQQTLVLKLAKAECETLRRNASIAYVASAENNALREEITVLQAALSAQPDSTDLIIENFQLREELEAMADRQAIRDLPDLADAVEALDTLFSSKVNVMDLKADFPIIPDDAVYMGLEEKIKLKQDDIADLKLQRDKLEFQIKSIEEDWQSVNEGTHKLSTAATDEQVDTIIEKTMDSIVGDQARDTWTAISSLFTRTF